MTREEAIECNKNLKMYMKISDKNQPCKFLEENYIALDMAIKALEQECCEDAVSRQAVLDMTGVSDWFDSSDDYNNFVEEICKLPPVTTTQRWIPCSERPPEEDGEYLCTIQEDEKGLCTYLWICDYHTATRRFSFDDEFEDDVIAWMPLPKPYKEESEGEK